MKNFTIFLVVLSINALWVPRSYACRVVWLRDLVGAIVELKSDNFPKSLVENAIKDLEGRAAEIIKKTDTARGTFSAVYAGRKYVIEVYIVQRKAAEKVEIEMQGGEADDGKMHVAYSITLPRNIDSLSEVKEAITQVAAPAMKKVGITSDKNKAQSFHALVMSHIDAWFEIRGKTVGAANATKTVLKNIHAAKDGFNVASYVNLLAEGLELSPEDLAFAWGKDFHPVTELWSNDRDYKALEFALTHFDQALAGMEDQGLVASFDQQIGAEIARARSLNITLPEDLSAASSVGHSMYGLNRKLNLLRSAVDMMPADWLKSVKKDLKDLVGLETRDLVWLEESELLGYLHRGATMPSYLVSQIALAVVVEAIDAHERVVKARNIGGVEGVRRSFIEEIKLAYKNTTKNNFPVGSSTDIKSALRAYIDVIGHVDAEIWWTSFLGIDLSKEIDIDAKGIIYQDGHPVSTQTIVMMHLHRVELEKPLLATIYGVSAHKEADKVAKNAALSRVLGVFESALYPEKGSLAEKVRHFLVSRIDTDARKDVFMALVVWCAEQNRSLDKETREFLSSDQAFSRFIDSKQASHIQLELYIEAFSHVTLSLLE